MAEDTAKTLADLKTMIGLKSDSQDDVLKLIIENTTQALQFKLGLGSNDKFPQELNYILLEVCIRRFNRRKNEGMTAYSQEGQSMTFNSNDFDDFADDINAWKQDHQKAVKSLGKVSFISGYSKG